MPLNIFIPMVDHLIDVQTLGYPIPLTLRLMHNHQGLLLHVNGNENMKTHKSLDMEGCFEVLAQ
jgi:hypothetical protein